MALHAGAGRVLAEESEREAAFRLRLQRLEARAGGRLGVHILDTATGQAFGYRSDERFMLLSSFKHLAGAFVLHRVDAGLESLARRIVFSKSALVPWSPRTEEHADGSGMTVGELCEAAITTSDNTAANLILASFGGPAALTDYLRQLGDPITRLDRSEPELNVKHAELPLDTTSPRAMVGSLQKLSLGSALSPQSRHQLQQWLLANTTGGRRLKAGLPPDWRIGDKTGSNTTDANDVAIIWPPGRSPLLVAVYLADSRASSEDKEATIAAVATELPGIAGLNPVD